MSGFGSKKSNVLFRLIAVLPLFIFLFSFLVGPYPVPLKEIPKAFVSLINPSSAAGESAVYRDILFKIRFPRLLLALAVGAALSVSGASLQALFKNPLVNEYILGISSGAAFGAALSLVFLGRRFPPQVMAFVFALAAILIVLLIARNTDSRGISLLLSGVIVSAFFSALLALVQFFASPYALQALVFWLMGSLSGAVWKDLLISLPVMAAGVAVLILLRWRMNVLSLSDEEARSLGVDVRREKLLVITAAALATAAATAVAGIIGWFGLIIPHLVRMTVGADNRRVIPLSAALGAALLLLADDITRSIAGFEIPIGIFTSIIGIPLFVYLLKKSKAVWL
jgi:iron complex transport system permease protein